VQAIDSTFAVSPFAEEANFTVTNTPPVALAQSVSLPEDGSVPITLQAFDPDYQPLTFQITGSPSHGALNGAVPHLTYEPSTNYFGPDAFQFGVSDGTASSVEAIVSIQVMPVPDTDSASLALTLTEEGDFQLVLHGEPYQLYRIEVSEDLMHWMELATQPASPDGKLFVEDSLKGHTQRFYRARPEP
jgi:Bacterial Ig domain